jgi:predicted alpha/beta hydrolase family esterase
MKRAILIHGTPPPEEYSDPKVPTPSNCHWFPWMQKQLSLNGYEAQTPEMPIPYKPDYSLWKRELERFSPGEDTLLIGHSCGGGFLVRWLSDNKIKVARTILVAPWMDPERNWCVPGFYDFQVDKELTRRTDLHVIYSDNDSEEVEKSAQLLFRELPAAHKHLVPGMGHFCCPELLELKTVALQTLGRGAL